MPILDVMPVSEWDDLRTLLVGRKIVSDKEIAEEILDRDFESAQTFTHLRLALEHLLKSLNLKKKAVLLPRYICKSLSDIVAKTGYQLVFYDSIHELKKFDFKKIGMVIAVHSFGIKVLNKETASFIKKNAVLVEDFAHTFDAGEIFGDYVMFHFAKKIPNIHGGILVSFDKKIAKLHNKSGIKIGELINFCLKLKLFRGIINLYRTTRKLPEENDGKYKKIEMASEASKRLFLKQLRKFRENADLFYSLRECYYQNIPSGFRPLASENQKDLFHFPVLIDSGKNRDEILKRLRVYGIFADRLWYNSESEMAKRILLLPVSPYMSQNGVKMICKLLKNV